MAGFVGIRNLARRRRLGVQPDLRIKRLRRRSSSCFFQA